MKLIHSLAALAVVVTATPALAKPGHAGGPHARHQGFNQGFAQGCPPGLAKKRNGCLPPGQAKKLGIGDRLPSYLSGYNVPLRYQDRFRDDPYYSYRYEDESIYRVNRQSGLIDSIISVLGF